MIRFRRLFGTDTEHDRRQLAEIQELFRRAFPYDPDYAETIAARLERQAALPYEVLLLVAEDARARVLGFTFTFYFPDIRFGYLDYIASDPDRPARGIGGALYEGTRELLTNKGARGLFLDVPTDDPARISEPARLPVNRKRLKFYERYGALPVAGTAYEALATEANEGFLTHLVYDALGRRTPLRRAELRKAVARIYEAKYGMDRRHADVRAILRSIADDPVALRRPRYITREAPPPARRWLKPVTLVVAERHEIHHLREKGYVQRPVRVDAVLRGLADLPCERRPVRHFSDVPIKAVHSPDLVAFLEGATGLLDPKALIYPNVFPIRRAERRPRSFEMRAGYFCIDTFTPLTHNAYRAARAAVDCALTAADLVRDGARLAYALCRPPGHHAERRVYGGFCYFNNAAIAAHRLSAHGRVAFIDIDHHHGNGSQDIFYRRNDVLVVSIHGHPRYAYPYFSGYADERGEGDGLGYNFNYPLKPGADDTRYLEVLDQALARIRRFKPQWFVVSLGFDIMRGDPTGQFVVSVRGMRQIGERLGRLGLPTLVVQEGGYSRWNLRRGARAFFLGLAGTWY